MPAGSPQSQEHEDQRDPQVTAVFDDFEAKSNLVGLYNLLLTIDRRTHPELYD